MKAVDQTHWWLWCQYKPQSPTKIIQFALCSQSLPHNCQVSGSHLWLINLKISIAAYGTFRQTLAVSVNKNQNIFPLLLAKK